MNNKLYFSIKVFAILGIILACFLLWEQFFHPSFEPCKISGSINCDAIVSGSVAKTLGIPTPLYGLIGYVIILVSSVLKKKKLLLGMSTFGLLFCGWIAYQELFLLHVICPVCIGCDIIITTIFILSLVNIKISKFDSG